MAGRKRIADKMPVGVYLQKGAYYCRPTNALMREIFAVRFPGKKSIALGVDEREMREQWKKYFRDDPLADGSPTGTVSELIARYEREILPDVPATTRDTEGYWLPNLLERFGRIKYAKSEVEAVRGDFLRRMHVQAYLTECAKTRPVAVNREISTLRKIFRYAQSWGLTEFNPCMDVRRNTETPRDTYISDAILLTIYQKAHPVLQCIIDIAQMFGCRPGEARGLRDDDILDDGVRLIPLKGKRGQPNKPRIYSWSDDLVQVIERSKQLRAEILAKTGKPRQPFLFLTPQGEPYNKDALVRVWSRTVERAGYDSTMYHLNDIRAKTGSDVYAAGNEAADHLGHTDSRTTRRVYDRLPRKIAPVVPISSGKRRTA